MNRYEVYWCRGQKGKKIPLVLNATPHDTFRHDVETLFEVPFLSPRHYFGHNSAMVIFIKFEWTKPLFFFCKWVREGECFSWLLWVYWKVQREKITRIARMKLSSCFLSILNSSRPSPFSSRHYSSDILLNFSSMTNSALSQQVSEAIDNFVLEVGEPDVVHTPRRRRNFRDWLQRLASLSHQEHWFALCAVIYNEGLGDTSRRQSSEFERSLSQVQTKVVRAIVSRVIHPFEGESPRVVSAYARRQVAPSHNSLTLLAILDARMSEFFNAHEPNTTTVPNTSVLDAPLPVLHSQVLSPIAFPLAVETVERGISSVPEYQREIEVSQPPNLVLPTQGLALDRTANQFQVRQAEALHGVFVSTGEIQAPISRTSASQGATEAVQGPDTSFSTRVDTNVQPDATRPPSIPNLLNQPTSTAEDSKSVTTNFDV